MQAGVFFLPLMKRHPLPIPPTIFSAWYCNQTPTVSCSANSPELSVAINSIYLFTQPSLFSPVQWKNLALESHRAPADGGFLPSAQAASSPQQGKLCTGQNGHASLGQASHMVTLDFRQTRVWSYYVPERGKNQKSLITSTKSYRKES